MSAKHTMPGQQRPRAALTAEQQRIRQLADDLLATLAAVVPDSVVHYAVEGTRCALRILSREVRTIRTQPPTTGPDLGEEVEDGWGRYRAIRLELRDLTLWLIVETVISLVPQAAFLHLDIRYPGRAGEVSGWRYRRVCDAAGVELALADEVELQLENDLNDLLADLARFAEVTRTGRINLAATPPTLSGDD